MESKMPIDLNFVKNDYKWTENPLNCVSLMNYIKINRELGN